MRYQYTPKLPPQDGTTLTDDSTGGESVRTNQLIASVNENKLSASPSIAQMLIENNYRRYIL
jgi:hypothetical protein